MKRKMFSYKISNPSYIRYHTVLSQTSFPLLYLLLGEG